MKKRIIRCKNCGAKIARAISWANEALLEMLHEEVKSYVGYGNGTVWAPAVRCHGCGKAVRHVVARPQRRPG